MSYADYLFAKNCTEILTNGFADDCFQVRTKWPDGESAHTVKTLYVTDRYDLSDGNIPIMTLRKQGIKNSIQEVLWIYQKKSNNVKDLGLHIWDAWADEKNTIGKAYGYQIGQTFVHHKLSETWNDLGTNDEERQKTYDNLFDKTREDNDTEGLMSPVLCKNDNDLVIMMDQMDAVLYDLMHNPGSRRIMTNTYVHRDLHEMGLQPCAYQMIFNVTMNRDKELLLNGCLNQRSQDMLTANGWNVMQYAALLMMVARHVGMKPGIFVHNIFDCHIYDRHIPLVKELLANYACNIFDGDPDFDPNEVREDIMNGNKWAFKNTMEQALSLAGHDAPFANPTTILNTDKRKFYDFRAEDFSLENYQYLPFDHKIEVAE